MAKQSKKITIEITQREARQIFQSLTIQANNEISEESGSPARQRQRAQTLATIKGLRERWPR